MIQAFAFDLDGTLVKTEQLKALSYAKAAVDLCPDSISETEVINYFKTVVGLSRREVARALVERFDLTAKAQALEAEFGVSGAWQAFVQVRLKYYNALLSDPAVLQTNRWPHATAVLAQARARGCKTALATMSHCEQVKKVLAVLDLQNSFDFIVTRDDVEHGKPNPEIYLLVAEELNVSPQNVLVLEDSPAGVKAALAANMTVIAVSTPFTRAALHSSKLLPGSQIVDDHETLNTVIEQVLNGRS